MPVIRPASRKGPIATLGEQLTDLMIKELTGERTRMGPVIFELPTGQLNRIDVIVIWETWKTLPTEERSNIVRNAYTRFTKMLESSIHVINPSKDC